MSSNKEDRLTSLARLKDRQVEQYFSGMSLDGILKRPKSVADFRLLQSQLKDQRSTQANLLPVLDPQSAKAQLFGRIILDTEQSLKKQEKEVTTFMEREMKR
mmetsp:Transcript_37514/g.27656  ORF Transcript_37514/g.27656 Transcript_37514/m.27656 type:complete len:102 (+) Transcript_37514:1-306(+)